MTGLNEAGYKASYANFVDGTRQAAVAVASGDVRFLAGGAMLNDHGILSLTNRGTQGPDVSSAGYEMVSTLVGTSFAAPQAAGVAALMLAIDPSLSAPELLAALTGHVAGFPTQFSGVTATCDATHRGNCVCTTATCGSGVLDAQAAVLWAMARADANPDAVPFTPSGQAATFIGVAGTTASGGTTTGSDGGGGGGAVDALALGALLLATVWRSKGLSGRVR